MTKKSSKNPKSPYNYGVGSFPIIDKPFESLFSLLPKQPWTAVNSSAYNESKAEELAKDELVEKYKDEFNKIKAAHLIAITLADEEEDE